MKKHERTKVMCIFCASFIFHLLHACLHVLDFGEHSYRPILFLHERTHAAEMHRIDRDTHRRHETSKFHHVPSVSCPKLSSNAFPPYFHCICQVPIGGRKVHLHRVVQWPLSVAAALSRSDVHRLLKTVQNSPVTLSSLFHAKDGTREHANISLNVLTS